MKAFILGAFFVFAAAVAGYSLQEESGACLPDHNQAEVENKKFCHCMSMGGVDLCHDGKAFSYQEWAEENSRREGDIDPKTKKQKKPDIPLCSMACKEDHCECCNFFYQRYKKKAAITIPYDEI